MVKMMHKCRVKSIISLRYEKPEAIAKQAINAVMPDLFRQLSMNGRDADPYQSVQDDSGYFEIASNESISKDLQII